MERCKIFSSIFVIVVLNLIWAVSAGQAQTYSGQATGIRSTVITNLVPGVTTAVTDTGPLPTAGGSITLASASANVAGVVTAGASTTSTSGSGNTSQSTASVEQLDVSVAGLNNGLRVRADAVASTTQCTCPSGSCTGNSTITNLRVGTAGGGAQIVVTGQINQTVIVTIGRVTLTIVINEHIVSPSSITVNALHITLADSFTGITTDVVVASAHSDISCITPQLNDKFSGRATGLWLGVSTLIPPTNVSTIVSDTGFLPTSGGSISVTTAGASVPGTLSTGVATSNTSGGGDMSQSDSTVNNLNLSLIGGVTIGATILHSNTQCACGVTPPVSCTGGSVVTDLAVTVAGKPLVINISGQPNQVVTLPLGLGMIIINEQIRAGAGDITVNALHVLLTPLGLASTDLVIAHSHSDIVCSLAPTAAGASVSGRVLSASGQPVSHAIVVVQGQNGHTWRGTTSSLGYYVVEDIPVGSTYFVDVSHKRYTFPTRVISLNDSLSDIDFVADP